MLFAKRLSELRNNLKLTQQDLADKLGKSQRTIAAWEGNTRNPPIEMLGELADFFHVSIDYLLGRTDIPNIYLDTKKGPLLKDQEQAQKIASTIHETTDNLSGIPIPQDAEALAQFVRKIVDQALDEQLSVSDNPSESQDHTT